MSHIVKKSHQIESFDHQKLQKSICASCLSVKTPVGEAELTAKQVCISVLKWLENKLEVTSADIRRKSGEALSMHNPEAAYAYIQQDIMT